MSDSKPPSDKAITPDEPDSADSDGDSQVMTDYEQSEEVQKMLRAAPFALPLPVEMLKENRVRVSEIPKGHLLNRYSGDLDVRVSKNAPVSRPTDLHAFRKQPRAENTDNEWSRDLKSSLVSTPLPTTNQGRSPESRWFIRGVFHNHRFQLYFGAVMTILIFWVVPASVISAMLLVLSTQMPERFDWVSPQLIWVPAALVLVGLLYMLFGLTSSCCVCRHKLFIYRSKVKDSRAHHIPGMGHVLPLCLHLVVFRWFRCPHCGTPIRLKK